MIASAFALFAAQALAQGLPVSLFDDGAIAGRVCLDEDHDGSCGADEPGLLGATLVLETGLTVQTDAQGRFHLAKVSGRAPDSLGGGRLQPGRHRLKVDARALPPGAKVFPDGATVEVPMGGLAWVEFAVQSGERAPVPVELDGAAPRVQRTGEHSVEFELRLKAPDDAQVRWRGQDMKREAGVVSATVPLHEGRQTIVATAITPDGIVSVVARDVDVVRRPGSVLVIPRALRPLGRLHLPIDRALGARVELPPGSALSTDGAPVSLADGQGLARMDKDTFTARFEIPGVEPWEEELSLPTLRGVFLEGLLDVEATLNTATGGFHFFGHGAGVARGTWGPWSVSADLDLRDTDALSLVPSLKPLLAERLPEVFERQLELTQAPSSWADSSAAVASNPSEGRFRVEVARAGLGALRWGSVRAVWSDTEVGRFHRALQGASLEVQTPAGGSFGAKLKGFFAPGVADPLSGLARRPAHDRFEATGGTVFYLSNADAVQGSEFVTVEVHDAVTGLPLRQRHLIRGEDYALDAAAGRVLLARPLSFLEGAPASSAEPLTAMTTQVLVVDYEVIQLAGLPTMSWGGELEGRLGPVSVGAGYVSDGAYGLFRGKANTTLLGIWFGAEVARSAGTVGALAWSRDGGLAWQGREQGDPGAVGLAATVRARGKGLFGRGHFDVAWRWRESGFEDSSGAGASRQLSARAEQPLGPVVAFLNADLRDGVDPLQPFSTAVFHSRLLSGGVGYEADRFGVRLEVRDANLGVDSVDGLTDGGRLALGLSARYRVNDWLTLRAGHRQSVWRRGSGPGAWDDTFASLGADVSLPRGPELGLRAGWGPRLGPQAWGQVQYSRGAETWYGAQTLDVDGPSAGGRRFVSGARQDVAPGTAVFVEDVAAHDVDSLRMGRAIGLMQKVSEAFTVSGRYERGVRLLGDVAPDVMRDSGGAGVAWETERVRLSARAEARFERGAGGALTQWVGTAMADVKVLSSLSASGHLVFVHSARDGLLVSRTVDAVASAAWRSGPVTVVARYAYLDEISPPGRGALPRQLQVISLLPAVRIGDRFSLAAGGHLGLTPEGLVVSASLRPSVRVWRGLELGAEVARRSSAPGGGELTALRGEAGYRFNAQLFVGAGYTAFGFSGTGLDAGAAGSKDRVYLRLEAAY